MRILVTGGLGFIGSHVVDAFLADGDEVATVDDGSSGKNQNARAELFAGDITYPKLVETAVRTFAPHSIVHLAAQPSLFRSEQEPAFDATVNIVGTLNVMQAAKKYMAHMVFASTSAVYDVRAAPPFRENSPTRPNRPYGIAKCASETYLRESGLNVAICRFGNVYGPRQVSVGENQLVPHALDHMLKGKEFKVNGDGTQTRDFVFVKDLAGAITEICHRRASGTYNLSKGIPQSVNKVLETLKGLVGYKHNFEYGPGKEKEPANVHLDCTKAMNELGWFAKTLLEEGLAETLAWYKTC